MGCWNHTCSLTNLPIRYGEDVYVMILQESNYEVNSFCYPYKQWTPLPFIFTGKYNDYGAVEECKGMVIPRMIECIKKHLVELKQGDNQYHDIPVTKELFNIDYLFECDHEERLFVKPNIRYHNDGDKVYRLKHIVFKKYAFEKLLSEFKYDTWYDDGDVNYDIVRSKLYEDLPKFSSMAGTLTYRGENRFLESVLKCNERNGTITHGQYYWESLFGFPTLYDYITKFGKEKFYEYMQEDEYPPLALTNSFTEEELKYYCDQAAMYHIICAYMNMSRKSWTVPSGVGSQDIETSAQALIANIILSTIEDDIIRNEEEYEE